MTNTIDYYNNNAEVFIRGTLTADMREARERFTRCLPEGAFILDFGCGTGRDSKAFLEQGFRVDAVDGSQKMCEAAAALTGLPVRQMLFQELDAEERYDGIWACASILHLPKEELKTVFPRMIRAVKTGGLLYVSFKYGTQEGFRHERYFTDFTKETLENFLQAYPDVCMVDEWISQDVRKGRENEQWLNVILRKE